MKYLNIIVTACFMVVFSGMFFLTTESIDPEPPIVYSAPAPDSGMMEEKKSAPIPPHSAVVQTEDLAKNEYVRGAIGAVIGWVVKGICEFLFGVITPILSFFKEALMRRFG